MVGNFKACKRFFALRVRSPKTRALVLCLSALAAASVLRAEKLRNHFDTDSVGRAPGFFDATVLGAQAPARWIVLTDLNPPSAPNRLVQVDAYRPEDSIAAVIRRGAEFRDGTLSVFVKQGSARAGIVLRLADERDFLVLLADGNSGDVVLTSYRGGAARELGRGRAAFEKQWENVSITATASNLTVSFDGRELFDAKDPHPASGRTGLATAGPREASFDEFVIEPAEK
jgi:hypothetical protein